MFAENQGYENKRERVSAGFSANGKEVADDFGEQVIIGHPYIFDRWTIDEENINLKLVNQTHDYFRSNRVTIVNKELFYLIEAKIPGIRKKSIPIFKQNQDDIQE